MKEDKVVNNELMCGCGHCHNEEKLTRAIGEGKLKNFIINYGLTICTIFISVIFWIIGKFVTVSVLWEILFFAISAVIVGYKVLYMFIKNIFRARFFDENSLMIIASIAAFVLGEFSEGALIMILFVTGELLEEVATGSSRKKIAGLAHLKCVTVHLITKNGVSDVIPDDIEISSIIQINKGEVIPIDGVLLDKFASLDLKTLTGESAVIDIQRGEKILSGSVNVGESFVMRTEKEYKDSTAERIVSLVENSISNKAKSQKFISIFAKFYTPIIVFIGLVIAVIPPLFQNYNFSIWIYKALTFIVISCPCALVISIPLGYFVGIGSLARNGILVKGSKYLEILSKINTVAFDKTGTLTTGKFNVENIKVYENFMEKDVLTYAASLEKYSSHPIARAICEYCKNINKIHFDSVNEVLGRGICGEIDGRKIAIGNYSFISTFCDNHKKSDYVGTVLYLSIDGIIACEFNICDTLKDGVIDMMKNLKKIGVDKQVILSGDNSNIVKKVSEKLGIFEHYGELLPEQKLKCVEKLKENKRCKILFAGDGINDAPVLSLADVGVAMGGLGSEISVETADVVIMDDDIKKIPLLTKHAKKVKNIVLQNIIFSILIKLAIMLLSLITNLPIWLSMFADVGVMLLAILNSLRNYRIRKMK